MGLLSTVGTPLSWEDTKKHADHVRYHGISQFINIWKSAKNKERDVLLWGDEVEYHVVTFDDEKNAKVSLRASEILLQLKKKTGENIIGAPLFHEEYGRFMLESTPGTPYTGGLQELLTVETDMRNRRKLAKSVMNPDEFPITIPAFPRLGAQGQFTEPFFEPTGPVSRSLFIPDEIINPHFRFPTLTANIRERRGSKVAINVPIFLDENTRRPFIDPTVPRERRLYPEDDNARSGAAKDNHIYLDAMGFGMGCCCLQITFQAKNLIEARRLYDQLAPVGPIMLALTAASPIWRGFLADQDARWNVIASSVDDRTKEERGLAPLKNDRFLIPKSRYDTISSYISQDPQMRKEYNDTNLVRDEAIRQRLLKEGVDELMADHVSHLFIRDPLVVYTGLLEQDDFSDSNHFELCLHNILGLLVEYTVNKLATHAFQTSFTWRAILSFRLNFYIPISKIDENMSQAHCRNAALDRKFWFRKDVFESRLGQLESKPIEDENEKMTVNEIVNGQKSGGFPGLCPLITRYLDSINTDVETRCRIQQYIDLVSGRATGKVPTVARWMREFVRSHPSYNKDSLVTDKINYDLLQTILSMNEQ